MHVRFAFAAIALVCFALLPVTQATCREGCLTNQNTVLGEDVLFNNGGFFNTAVGWNALKNNLTAWNTAVGAAALSSNTTGYDNTAIGVTALEDNIDGNSNTATGRNALLLNTTGSDNTGTGTATLAFNTTGNSNVANGMSALTANITGSKNTAAGYFALSGNTTGDENIAIGYQAGLNLTAGSNNIDIGNSGVAAESGTIRIGTIGTQTATYIAGIRDTQIARGAAVPVGITPDGQLGVKVSSVRFKEAIKPIDKASEAIFSLQPVSFRYKNDPELVPQFGLVAEEVAKVNPDLVVSDVKGKPFTVRYDEINAMLLNEFLKEHHKVEQLTKDFESKFAEQQQQIEQLTASLQKVSAQLELKKSAPQTVLNNQ